MWLIVWTMGILAVYWRDSFNADHELTVTHRALGMTILAIISLWTAWRLLVKPSQSMASMTQDERTAHIGHILLVVLALFSLPITGWLLSSASGEPVTLLWMVQMPTLVSPQPGVVSFLSWTHSIIAWLTGLLALAHIGMALKVHFVDGKDTLRKMLPGG